MNDRKENRDGAPDAVSREPTAAQLRDDIDSGLTRDKVAHADPAAAPLGTDDEAAGSPPTGEQVSIARRHETGGEASNASPGDRQPDQGGTAPSGRLVWPIVALVVLCALVGIALSL